MAQVPQPTSAMQPVLRALRLPHLGAGSKIAALVLAVIVVLTLLAGWIAPHDPLAMNPMARLQGPIEGHPLGTDNFGRDIFSRVLIGGQLSLIIGIATAVVSVLLGLIIGMIAGFFRTADAIIMRAMDALMAIPSILLAIALVALNGPSVGSVIAAITIPEIPRVVRLVRAVVLSAREEPYVEAAIALGTPMRKILVRHLVPNTTAPLIVQGTYILASAILTEAILSFLGAGVSTETPTWGNIMAEGRLFFRIKPELILYPGIALSLCILSINLLGDAARDMLDPRLKKRAG
ncbi:MULTISPECIES: ABC transporter permease [Paracoccus]|jgi:peptide/nickel transport system permease protein|uniref:ABC transporter permease n=1 Tax=Paracoccus haeundaensis TaxID=225362 RepID=A0A5C4R6A1_9RHOB|nr:MULTISPECIES: ABC transporter permease [Paracoccus]AZY94354.1 ABC transporter permease [Paracoccus sp. Arc7-R13]KIX18819.1 peptide ABC transporter permease [Paracoccus sp. 228]MBF5078466.1 ABC transporter permease [Paracoccus sp. NBH48]QXI63582.1 Glutathione transport system permease protein GsiD [Paracoccus marcusii]TNC05209.1 ABC transporter permease [Paracoccus marcusii]|tara:strand:- start:1046 stop:1921 length:876 start_codon:yes stop_codon:yes gene_type:complete